LLRLVSKRQPYVDRPAIKNFALLHVTLERFTLAEATLHGSSAGLAVFRALVVEQSLGTEAAPKLDTKTATEGTTIYDHRLNLELRSDGRSWP